MRRLVLAMALVLSACASDKADGPAAASGPGAPAPPPPMAVTTRPAPAPEPAAPAPPSSPPDQCGAYALQDLVGKPRTSIPVPVDPSKRRVVCTTCPMTEDVRPDRLTILYDANTGLVTKLQCQ